MNLQARFSAALIAATVLMLCSRGVSQTLWEAAAAGDVAQIQQMIGAGRDDINTPDPETGRTPLIIAIFAGHPDAALALIDAGADINRASGKGLPPICFAADAGDVRVIRKLVEKGADLNTGQAPNLVPLSYAAGSGKLEAMKAMIELGAKPDGANDYGITPMFTAAFNGRLDSMKLLMEHGGRIDHRNNAGFTPLISAAETGQLEVAKFLVEHGNDPNQVVPYSPTDVISLVGWAARSGHADMVQYLLSQGAVFPPNDSALSDAAYLGHVDCMKLIFDSGGRLTDEHYRDAMDSAARGGRYQAFMLLLHAWQKWNGAAVSDDDNRNERLMTAAYEDDAPALGGLLAGPSFPREWLDAARNIAMRQGNVDASRILKRTIDTLRDREAAEQELVRRFMDAAGKGNIRVVRSMLLSGLSPNVVGPDFGFGPVSRTISNGQIEVLKLLIDHGASVNPPADGPMQPPIISAALRPEITKLLLKLGADPNVEWHGRTALGDTALYGDPDSARLLLDHGARIDSRHTEHNRTPVMLATWYNQPEVAKLLIERGADLTLTDALGATPLAMAEAVENTQLIDLMRAKGAPRGNVALPAPLWVVFSGGPQRVKRWLDEGGDPLDTAGSFQFAILQIMDPGNFHMPVAERVEIVAMMMDRGRIPRRWPGALPSAIDAKVEIEVVKAMVEHGANVNDRSDGTTALHAAARRGDAEIVKFLLSKGADPTARDSENRTPLDIARTNPAILGLLQAAIGGLAAPAPLSEEAQ